MFTNRFGVLSAARLADDVRGHEVNSRTDLEPWVFGAVPGPPEVPPKGRCPWAGSCALRSSRSATSSSHHLINTGPRIPAASPRRMSSAALSVSTREASAGIVRDKSRRADVTPQSFEKNAVAFPRDRIHIAFDSQEEVLGRVGCLRPPMQQGGACVWRARALARAGAATEGGVGTSIAGGAQ